MKLRSSKAACFMGAILAALVMPLLPFVAGPESTYEYSENTITESEAKVASYYANVTYEITTGEEEDKGVFYNRALAVVSPYLEVYAEADIDSDVVGRLYENSVMDTLDVGADWTLISSGNCTGYVKTESLLLGDEAAAYASLLGEFAIIEGYTIEEVEMVEKTGLVTMEKKIAAAQEAAERKQMISASTVSGADVTYNAPMTVSDDELWLLACIVSWEARGESYEGKLAVANVVLNRVRSSYYPDTISGVVYQRGQFSGVLDGNGNISERFGAVLSEGPANEECRTAAVDALAGINNAGSYCGFLSVSKAKFDSYSSYMILGCHCFH
ncbi:MAG: cell wall hydrolase [Lachnospira sp.]